MQVSAQRLLGGAALTVILVGMGLLMSGWIFYPDDRRPSHSRMVGTLEIGIPEGRGGARPFWWTHAGS
jgi:hypothetical protein